MVSSPASSSSSGSGSNASSSSIASSSTSVSSSSSTSSLHHASLVDPSKHSPVLLRLLDNATTPVLIDYIVDRVADTVDFAMDRPTGARSRESVAKFTKFATKVITRAELTMPVILSTLVYLDRARSHLHIALEEWALERVFLGAIMVASKYLNDSTLKNVHWAMCTGVFGKRDVGRIEREFLEVLDWELGITEAQLLTVAGEPVEPQVANATPGDSKDMPIILSDYDVDDIEIDFIVEHESEVDVDPHSESTPPLYPCSHFSPDSTHSSSPRTPETLVGSGSPSEKYDHHFDLAAEYHNSSPLPTASTSTNITNIHPCSQHMTEIAPAAIISAPEPALTTPYHPHHASKRPRVSSFASLIHSFPGIPSLPSMHSLQKRARVAHSHFGVRVGA